jgi:hypothetical protein
MGLLSKLILIIYQMKNLISNDHNLTGTEINKGILYINLVYKLLNDLEK